MKRVQDMTPSEIARLAVLVGAGAIVTWIGILLLAWRFLGLREADPALWGYLEGMSSAAVLGSVIGGGLAVLVQLVELIESRKRDIAVTNLRVYDTIFGLMMSDDNIDARRWIYQELPRDPETGLSGLDSEGQRRIKLVLNSLDYLGLAVAQDIVAGDDVVEWASPFVVKVWDRLGPYVDYEARRRNEPDYYRAARDLAERCRAVRQKRVGDATPVWVEDSL
jgi:hypothetical protein